MGDFAIETGQSAGALLVGVLSNDAEKQRAGQMSRIQSWTWLQPPPSLINEAGKHRLQCPRQFEPHAHACFHIGPVLALSLLPLIPKRCAVLPFLNIPNANAKTTQLYVNDLESIENSPKPTYRPTIVFALACGQSDLLQYVCSLQYIWLGCNTFGSAIDLVPESYCTPFACNRFGCNRIGLQ